MLKKRPDLILLTDDVYGTFVPGFRSLMGEFPKNTIGVYSYSKYFGCTGWRLGTVAVHEDNIFDEMIAQASRAASRSCWTSVTAALTLEPRKLAFIDRIVADSRDVALNHTAGLSLPQQVMMTLFSLSELMDEKKDYQKACIGIVKKRVEATIEGLGIEVGPNQYFDYYYGLIDFEFWARKYIGEDVVKWMKENVHPLDIVFRLAEDHGIVLLNGSGFAAPDWSVRISFANLDDHVYDDIGRAVRAIARGYRLAYEACEQANRGEPPVTSRARRSRARSPPQVEEARCEVHLRRQERHRAASPGRRRVPNPSVSRGCAIAPHRCDCSRNSGREEVAWTFSSTRSVATPELAIFLTLAVGFFIGKPQVRQLQPRHRRRHAAGRGPHRSTRNQGSVHRQDGLL